MDQVGPDMFVVRNAIYFYGPTKQPLTRGVYRKIGDKMQRIEPGSMTASGAAKRGGGKRRAATKKRRGASHKHRTRTHKKRATHK